MIRLGGTNTLRLTIGGKPTKDSRLLSLNYLLFVPAGGGGVTIFDNFNDGNDTTPSPAWMGYDPIRVDAWSFPGGNTYRIQSGPSPDPGNFGQGRAGSIQPSSLSDFYISVDVVGWDDSIHQVFGLLARIGTPGQEHPRATCLPMIAAIQPVIPAGIWTLSVWTMRPSLLLTLLERRTQYVARPTNNIGSSSWVPATT